MSGLAALAAATGLALAVPGTAEASTTSTLCSVSKAPPGGSGTVHTCTAWTISRNAAGARVTHPQTCTVYNNSSLAIAISYLDYGKDGVGVIDSFFPGDSNLFPGLTRTYNCGNYFTSWGYYPSPRLWVNYRISTGAGAMTLTTYDV